jgi:hypothetical protein
LLQISLRAQVLVSPSTPEKLALMHFYTHRQVLSAH